MVKVCNAKLPCGEINNYSNLEGHFLLKYAISAPSCLNTQPWLFKIQGDKIKLIVDIRRWRKIGDTDQRELLHQRRMCSGELINRSRAFRI